MPQNKALLLQINIRSWHFIFFLVGLAAVWHLQAFHGASEVPHLHAVRETWQGGRIVPAFDGFSTLPPTTPPMPPVAHSAWPSMSIANTESLIAELHLRRYDWEMLDRAGLKLSSTRQDELLHYLRGNKVGLRRLLAGTNLGLSAQTTVQLLQALSRRNDLTAALRETGLGAGADFRCDFDESPRDGGCQIRCDRGSGCSRADKKCKSLGHCVSIDVNRDRTWATLKSLQVYTPTLPPACDGYAFHPNGSAPTAIGAPFAIEFDDLIIAGGKPNESWCYRDTRVQPRTAAGASSSSYGGAKPLIVSARKLPGQTFPYSGNQACTLETCFDLERCRPHHDDKPDAPLRLYIDTPAVRSYDMRRWPSCMRSCLREGIVEAQQLACLVIPTVNLNCEWDVCDPSTHTMLRGMASWNHSGRNHIIWDYIDGPHIKYRTDDAVFLKTSMRLSEYRPGFDVPFPLLPNGEASHVTPAELSAAVGRRTILASFKGVCQQSSRRPALSRLHNGRDLIMLCTERKATASQWDYKTLMLTSTFSVAPAGNGLHSFRLAEAIFFGSIPVIVDDEIVLPFCSALDWRRFSVRITSDQVPNLPSILRAIPHERVVAMQQRLAGVKRRYFLFPFNTAMSLMRVRVREALRGG